MTTEEFSALDYDVMAHAFESHKTLGRLADESVDQADLAESLQTSGVSVLREVPVTVSFRTFSKPYFLDVVVAKKAAHARPPPAPAKSAAASTVIQATRRGRCLI